MSAWFEAGMANGRLVDLLIVFIVAEALLLAAHHRLTGRGVRLRDVAMNLLAGLCLMAALRCALAASGWPWVAGWLALSGVMHAADIAQRWRR
jgi:hypothetical protein